MHDLIRQLPSDNSAALRIVFELVSQSVFIVDRPSDRIIDVNIAACNRLGCKREALIGRSWSGTIGQLGEMRIYSTNIRQRLFVAIAGSPPSEVPNRSTAGRDALTELANREALIARFPRAGKNKRLDQLAI